MAEDLEHSREPALPQALRPAWQRALLLGPDDLTDRALRWAWGVAIAARLTLPNALDEARFGIHMTLAAFGVGIVLLGGRVFYAGALAMLLMELLSGRDWLTQTMVMVFCATLGLALSQRDAPRSAAALRLGTVGVVAATYLFAAFHKFNSAFFDATISCATHGWRRLDEAVRTELGMPEWVNLTAAPATVGVELLIAFAIFWRPRVVLLVAPIFHIPLTLAIEPAFPFVMALGWIAALCNRELGTLWTTLRHFAVPLLANLAASTAFFAWWTTPDPAWLDAIKCGAMWTTSLLAALTIATCGLGTRPRWPAARWQWVAHAATALFVANALTPYVGTQFQHTAGMLSNLRIDEGCWNHWLVPESARRLDPYVRIDQVSIGDPTRIPAGTFATTEQVLLNTLWSTTALRSMRRNWCNERTAPIELRGTFRDAPLHITDLCDPTHALPRGPGAYGGDGLFDNYLRLQKNLSRQCPAACVH